MSTRIINTVEIELSQRGPIEMYDVIIHFVDKNVERRRLTREGLREVTKVFLRHMSQHEIRTAVREIWSES